MDSQAHSSTSPDSTGDTAAAAALQLLPSTSFVRPARKRPDQLQRNPVTESKFSLVDPPHLQRSQTSPGFSLHRRNHSVDAATPTPTANSRFFIPFSKGHQRTGSFDSPLRSAFDPALNTPDFPPRTATDPKGPLFSPQNPNGSQLFSPLRRGSNLFSPGTPSRLHQQIHRAVPSTDQSQQDQDSTRFSIQSSNRSSSGPPPLPASTFQSFLPAFTFQPGKSKPPAQPVPSGYEAKDIIAEESSGELEMPSPKAPDLRVEIKETTVQPPLTNPPNLPKRTASLKKSATPKRAQSTKKSFWNWGSSSKDDEAMEAAPTPQSPAVATPISAAPQSATRQAPPASPGYFGDDDYYASDDGYTSRSASPPPFSSMPSGSADTNTLIKELEDISSELASSIRREMDLEDEIDRIRTEMPSGPAEHNRRTSDYYSDSGASSARFPPPDVDLKLEGLEKMRRKAEQEKAQLRVEMAQKVQEDLNQRRALEMHVQSLEEQLSAAASAGGAGKERELETQLDDMKRRLNDEKSFKENFEDLLAGMREEIESFKHERDNLRDEIVPKLSSENQNLMYENSRMQQELQNLKNENQTLQNARKLQLHSSIKSIVEESPGSPEGGLSRSNSLKRSGSLNYSKSVRGRSGSLYGNQQQSKDALEPEALPERLKNAEEQRDAIQRTLKSLVLRQTQMTRQHAKQVLVLQTERDRALSGIPRRAGFAVEVHTLRHEVNKLRQRADDALEQKFQCEKGLTGLKMDLERAQQETSSLRELLQEHDITVPDLPGLSPTVSEQGDSLERAFEALSRAHADSVAAGAHSPTTADAHAARVAALSQQVSIQKASNSELRARLAEAVGRGEKEQAASARKINDLQSALRAAEERVMSAQSVSEDVMASHEEHVRDVKDAASEHSKRNMKTPGKGMSAAGRSGSQSSVFERTRLSKTTSGKGVSAAEAIQVRVLQNRVRELEEAAGQADEEMQGVVERMNAAQIEVADLQVQRDEAQKRTRKLQKEIEDERLQYSK